jgi:hypothetical protein
MQTGTEILLARMAEYPEEFIEGNISKWSHVMHMGNECLPDEDKAALKEAYTKAKIERFNGEVLATLAGEREPLGTVDNSVRDYKERYVLDKEAAIQKMLQHNPQMNAAQQSPYPSGGLMSSGGNGIWSNLF